MVALTDAIIRQLSGDDAVVSDLKNRGLLSEGFTSGAAGSADEQYFSHFPSTMVPYLNPSLIFFSAAFPAFVKFLAKLTKVCNSFRLLLSFIARDQPLFFVLDSEQGSIKIAQKAPQVKIQKKKLVIVVLKRRVTQDW